MHVELIFLQIRAATILDTSRLDALNPLWDLHHSATLLSFFHMTAFVSATLLVGLPLRISFRDPIHFLFLSVTY